MQMHLPWGSLCTSEPCGDPTIKTNESHSEQAKSTLSWGRFIVVQHLLSMLKVPEATPPIFFLLVTMASTTYMLKLVTLQTSLIKHEAGRPFTLLCEMIVRKFRSPSVKEANLSSSHHNSALKPWTYVSPLPLKGYHLFEG